MIAGRNGKTTPRYLSMAIATRLCTETAKEISWKKYTSLHEIKPTIPSINHLRVPPTISVSWFGTAQVEMSRSETAMFAMR